MERVPLIAFTGPEGSGKSTQAEIIANDLGIPHVSTGDMIREMAENDQGELGDACREMFKNHNYLPGPLLLQIVEKRLKREDTKNGLVLDGGFRTLEETKNFAKTIKNVKRDFDVRIIFLRLPYWKSMERISEGKRERKDDTSSAILSRLVSFHTELGERMSFIRNNWNLTIINAANKSIEEINQEVLNLVKIPQKI